MIFAVSNIAWDPAVRKQAYALMQQHGCSGLEIAPGLFFNTAEDPFRPTPSEAKIAIEEAAEFGLNIVSMQSLLFGITDAAMFETPDKLQRFQHGMERAIDLAGQIGIPNLVFGSPGQRIRPDTMTEDNAITEACEILTPLADRALAAGMVIALEFNPPEYGTNFMNTFEQTRAVVEMADHPAITLNFDVGAMYMNDAFNNIEAALSSAATKISHVHISEPFLALAPEHVEDTTRLLLALKAIGYQKAVSIEMKLTGDDGGQRTLDLALQRLTTARKANTELNTK